MRAVALLMFSGRGAFWMRKNQLEEMQSALRSLSSIAGSEHLLEIEAGPLRGGLCVRRKLMKWAQSVIMQCIRQEIRRGTNCRDDI